MTTKYLLFCSCGRSIPIETRHAGQSMQCECGAAVQAPTLREIAALPLAATEPAAAEPSAWGGSQRSVLVGAILLGAALAGGIFVLANRPISPFENITPERIQLQINKLSPMQSVVTLDQEKALGLILTRLPNETAYEKARAQYQSWLALVAAVGLAGAALVVTGLCARGQRAEARGLRVAADLHGRAIRVSSVAKWERLETCAA